MGKNHVNKRFKRKNKFKDFSKNYQKCQSNNEKSVNKSGFQRKSLAKNSEDHKVEKPQLKEIEVGIEEYTSSLPGFTGIIKARFSDFHVNEIDLDGREVKLTNQDIPKVIEDELENTEFETAKESLKDIITEEIWDQIEEILKVEEKNNSKIVEIDVTTIEKEKRGIIHKILKKQYGNRIIGSTINKDEKKLITIKKSNGKVERRSIRAREGEYTYFVLHKENVDTIQAASDLAQSLRLTSGVNYAGTKDKRAKTSQLICIRRRAPNQILEVSKRFPYMKVGNFEFRDKVLKLGDLKGNRFRIALRHIDGDEDKIRESLENLQNNGFINYYGLQRFGNCAEIPTYKIGIALLKSDFKQACELILKPRQGDSFLKEAREVWWKNRNSLEASAIIGNKKCIEKLLLNGLAEYGERDYATSLKRIPRNMLIMYTHSFQSLIWNKIASRRIRELGLKLIPGDLIYKDKDQIPYDIVESVEVDETMDCKNTLSDEIKETTIEEKISEFKAKVRPLTEDDISSGNYTIFDVVLPLPGCDITYPSNVVTDWYNELLAAENLTSEKLRHNVKTYSLLGSYRKLLIKPENLKWEFKKYNSATSTLIASDYEEFKGIKPDDGIPDGQYKALLLDFILPSSSYATMALRELLKNDTSSLYQSKLMKDEMKKIESCSNNICNDTEENINNTTVSAENIAGEKRKLLDDDDDKSNEDSKKIKADS